MTTPNDAQQHEAGVPAGDRIHGRLMGEAAETSPRRYRATPLLALRSATRLGEGRLAWGESNIPDSKQSLGRTSPLLSAQQSGARGEGWRDSAGVRSPRLNMRAKPTHTKA
jgi:hypothetical protein